MKVHWQFTVCNLFTAFSAFPFRFLHYLDSNSFPLSRATQQSLADALLTKSWWQTPGITLASPLNPRQFTKPELAYGLAMGGETDSQFRSQVHASHKKSSVLKISRWLAINFCRLVLGGQTVKKLRRLAYEFELDQSQRKPKTWVDLGRNASPFLHLLVPRVWSLIQIIGRRLAWGESMTPVTLKAWARHRS